MESIKYLLLLYTNMFKKKKRNEEILQLRISKRLKDKLSGLATKYDVGMSEIMRQLIDNHKEE